MNSKQTLEDVKQYYGEILQSTSDLQTSACCTSEAFPNHIKEIIKEIEPEILDRFYGCGSPIPQALEGTTALDLGCGTGRDVYILSKLVGEQGKVIGLDMTESQLHVARKHAQSQSKRFGFKQSNVSFEHGYIEDLRSAGIEDNSVDLITSNCVINLSPNKEKVFSEIFRALKPGGELYFSDVFANRRIPEPLKQDPVLRGECLSGALYIEDFRRILQTYGCLDFRTVTASPIEIQNSILKEKLGCIEFSSITIRAFKLNDLEDICEDYGQVAYYKGTIPECPNLFHLDDHHAFERNRPVHVCGNTASMLRNTRYGDHFRIEGDQSVHYGAFDCAPIPEAESNAVSCC